MNGELRNYFKELFAPVIRQIRHRVDGIGPSARRRWRCALIAKMGADRHHGNRGELRSVKVPLRQPGSRDSLARSSHG
jgi:hypothetical protein